jgi:hypothetical protein
MLALIFRRLLLLESGTNCRRCSEAIAANDPFGVSEGVCAPCRSW